MSQCRHCDRTLEATGGQARCEQSPTGQHEFPALGILKHWKATLRREHLTWKHFKGWLKLSRVRLRMWYAYVWHNPAPRPEDLGTEKAKGMRPVPIAFTFILHPDGQVYMNSRFGGQERVEEEALIGLVHREYRLLVRREYVKRGLEPPKHVAENP